jgi:hypothetical protein
MTFTRANALGWALYEVLTSAQMNIVDLNQSRAIDGNAGGTYNPSAIITVNQEVVISAAAAAGANATALTLTGKGNEPGISSTGGATSASGGVFTGGAPNGNGLNGIGTGTGWGLSAIGGATGGGVRGEGQGGGIGVVGVGEGAAAGVSGTGGLTGNGVAGQGGGTSGYGVYGHGTATDPGVRGEGGHNDGSGVEGIGGPTDGVGVKGTGTGDGQGGLFTAGANGAALNLAVQSTPTAFANGDVWVQTEDAFARINGKTRQLGAVKAWANVTTDGAGGATVNDGYNVASATIVGNTCELAYTDNFTNDNVACSPSLLETGAAIIVGVPENAAPSTKVTITVYDDATPFGVRNLGTSSTIFSVVICGELA